MYLMKHFGHIFNSETGWTLKFKTFPE